MLQLLKKAREQYGSNLPFVVYHKPGEDCATGIFQADSKLHPIGDYTRSGFVFAPFDLQQHGTLIIPDQILTMDLEIPTGHVITAGNAGVAGQDSLAKQLHLQLVQKGISAIKKGILKKVVLSRCFDVESPFSPFDLFSRLTAAYSQAFSYLWYHPKIGMWMGASPELLLHSDRETLNSISLAGTLRREEGKEPSWGPKERREQEMVTDYITGCLSPYLEEMEVSRPETVKAGSLWHLKSSIRGTLKHQGLQPILAALHPTPAVCGMPVEMAKGFILDAELYDREFYTGFLGEVHWGSAQQTDLYVNLRCMKIQHGRATVFVGGGITSDSDPQKEWEETVAKSETMLKVLGYSED